MSHRWHYIDRAFINEQEFLQISNSTNILSTIPIMSSEHFVSAIEEIFLERRHAGHSHAEDTGESDGTCVSLIEDNDEYTGARISAIFVVLIASAFGSFFPVLSSRYSMIRMPPWCFFIAKFFGSGVIISTAFIHLLFHSSHALGNSCLGGVWVAYPMAYGIALISLFMMFLGELLTHAFLDKRASNQGNSHSHFGDESLIVLGNRGTKSSVDGNDEELNTLDSDVSLICSNYYAQLTGVFVLEFGILFHSVFVGLALAVSGSEFVSLYIVIVFHQLFEGLGLGARIAVTPWPSNRTWTPWILSGAYAFVTPIAIAIGMGVRTTYDQGSRTALLTNGIFDAISAGILFYAGLVELIGQEFFSSNQFKGPGGAKKSVWAWVCMALGAGLMALLGKWA